ncbi:CPBP family intramembrane glutamic endopeptidase [Streptococcus suis]
MFQSFKLEHLKDKKNLLFLLLGLLAPLAYHGLNALFSNLLFLFPFMNEKAVLTYIVENPMFTDAIFCALMILLVLPFYKLVQKDKEVRENQETRVPFTIRSLFPSLVIALGVGGLSTLWQIFARTVLVADSSFSQSVQQFDTAFTSSLAPMAYFWSFLSIVLFGPIIEELIFRGLTYSGIDRIWGGIAAVLVSGIYFGLWHSMPIQIVYTAIMGLVLGFVYNATKNMWFPMVIHILNNFSSNLPPFLETDSVAMVLLVVKVLCILPMIYLVYRLMKNIRKSK